jgi:hypothetical protein
MKAFTKNFWCVAAAATLLAGVLAFAQQGKGKDAGGATGSTPNAGQNAAAGSGEKNSENKGKTVVALDGASKDAAKMTVGTMANVKNNPLYEQKSEGTNPLYEKSYSNLKTADVSVPASPSELTQENARYGNEGRKATKSRSGSAAGDHAVAYKDGEDGTSHTRPPSRK